MAESHLRRGAIGRIAASRRRRRRRARRAASSTSGRWPPRGRRIRGRAALRRGRTSRTRAARARCSRRGHLPEARRRVDALAVRREEQHDPRVLRRGERALAHRSRRQWVALHQRRVGHVHPLHRRLAPKEELVRAKVLEMHAMHGNRAEEAEPREAEEAERDAQRPSEQHADVRRGEPGERSDARHCGHTAIRHVANARCLRRTDRAASPARSWRACPPPAPHSLTVDSCLHDFPDFRSAVRSSSVVAQQASCLFLYFIFK